jgi:hypothetical protein
LKKLNICLLLVLATAIILTGCSGGGVTTPATDEAKIKSVINEYFLAINDQNWNKAKNYCVYGSEEYYAILYLEDIIKVAQQSVNTINITSIVNVTTVKVYGNYTEASGYINLLVTADGESIYNDQGPIYFELSKTGNSWKLNS